MTKCTAHGNEACPNARCRDAEPSAATKAYAEHALPAMCDSCFGIGGHMPDCYALEMVRNGTPAIAYAKAAQPDYTFPVLVKKD